MKKQIDRMNDPASIKRGIDTAEAFPIKSIVDRYASDKKLSLDIAEKNAKEAIRFLVVSTLGNRNPYTMMGPADDFWHTFIMFTRDYALFCKKVAGHFIHHIPANKVTNDEEKVKEVKGYLNFFSDYYAIYGEWPPSDVWPYPSPKTLKLHNMEFLAKECLGLTAEEWMGTVPLSGSECHGCGSPCGVACGCARCSCDGASCMNE